MKKRTKIILLILLAFFVGREFLPFEMSLYRANSDSSRTFNANTRISSFDLSGLSIPQARINLDSNNSYSIVLDWYGDIQEEGDREVTNPIVVGLSPQINISPIRYLPFIKPIKFSATLNYNWGEEIIWNSRTHSISDRGPLQIEGTYNIYGLCSAKKAKQMILGKIQTEITIVVCNRIHEVINNLK